MVEPNKQEVASTATFLEVVRRKYKYEKPQEGELGFGYDAELKGAEHTAAKQELHLLTRVFVHDENIMSAGEVGEVAAACGAIEELNLEGNPLTAWAPVVTIAVQLPSLHWLGLNRLRLEPLAAVPKGFGSAFGGLRTLCLSQTGLSWEQLLLLAEHTPQLEELHFSGNGVESLRGGGGVGALPRLHTLYAEDNAIASWEAVQPLATLPALHTLNLNGNSIPSVPPADGFASLRVLMLRANPITSWDSIDALDTFAALSEARLAELPLLSPLSAQAARRLVIARVGGLTCLNGGEIKSRTREDAERFYLRQANEALPEGGVPAALLERATSPDGERMGAAEARALATTLAVPRTDAWRAFEAANPRWRALLLMHGEQRASSAAGGGGGTLAAELIEITLRSTAPDAAALPPCSRRLPNGLPLKSVKTIACQLFKLEPTRQQLLYCPPGAEKDIPERLDDDTRTLAELGVESGSTIVVEEAQE